MSPKKSPAKEAEFSKNRLAVTGFIMGLADLVPGVSGGTVAFISGIYDSLLSAIRTVTGTTLSYASKLNLPDAWRSVPWGFLLPLFGGIAVALLSMSNIVAYLLEEAAILTWSVFFGLVAGSIVVVRKRIKTWSNAALASVTVGAFATFLLAGSGFSLDSDNPISYLLTGFVAFCAMILPGISGSLLMVLIGMYEAVIDALSNLELTYLLLVVLGGAIGLAVFSRLLSWLLRHRHDPTVAFLIGMMIGSLRRLWPFKDMSYTGTDYLQPNTLPGLEWQTLTAIILMVAAAALIIKLEYKIHAERD